MSIPTKHIMMMTKFTGGSTNRVANDAPDVTSSTSGKNNTAGLSYQAVMVVLTSLNCAESF